MLGKTSVKTPAKKTSPLVALSIVTGLTGGMMLLLWGLRTIFKPLLPLNIMTFSVEAVMILAMLAVNHWRLRELLNYRIQTGTQFWSVIWVGVLIVVINGGTFIAYQWINQNIAALVYAIVVAALVGFFEETMFRGLILQILLRSFGLKRVRLAVGVSSLLFALSHAGHFFDHLGQTPINTTLQIGYAFCLGVYFCAVTLRTGTLWWTIVIHAVFDMQSFMLTYQGKDALATVVTGQTLTAEIIVDLLIFIPILIIGFVLLKPLKQAGNI